MSEKEITIKPLCACIECGAEVVPTKKEAGQFLIQFRKAGYDKETYTEYGKRGGRPRKEK